MKISTSGLHPLYDQYYNDENRLTHALIHTISSSASLFPKFLKDIVTVKISISSMTFHVSTQKEPLSQKGNDSKGDSIPDAWIIDDNDKLGIVIEVKDKKNSLSLSQLRYHAKKIKRFKEQYLLIITPDHKKPEKALKYEKEAKIIKPIWCSWDDIYRWLVRLSSKSIRTGRRELFLLSSMLDYLERRREVLGFQGIVFSRGYDVFEAKEILNAEMEELSSFVMRHYKGLGRRRPAITTFSQEGVWDCFGSNEVKFVADLHITLSISENWQDISITVPNSAKKPWRCLKILFSEEYENELYSILGNLRKNVPNLFIEFNQRHFIAQKFGIKDGFMEFNVDTLGKPFRKKKSPVKEFSMWLYAIRMAISDKRGINGQVMFKSRFYLNSTKKISEPQFINTVQNAIKAFKPLYDFLKETKQ